MRNLKRVLSLALALVMVLGMMVIGTSAATFAEEEIENLEAVQVMNALGIIKGDGDKFYPDRVLTREEAAKILAYVVLGPDVEDYLSGSESPFTDVKADRWSAKYIAFCKNAKYIHGETETTFNPKGQLTVVGFGKLLLGALGYDTTAYTGGGWIDAVAADMAKAGLDIVEFDAKTLIDRDTACQMALIAMMHGSEEVEYVVYDVNGTFADSTDDVKLAVYDNARDAALDVQLLGKDSTYYKKETTKVNILSEVYGVSYAPAVDAFGRPGDAYTWGTGANAVEMFYADKALATFEGPATQGALFAAAKAGATATKIDYTIIQDGVNIDAWGKWSAAKTDAKTPTNGAADFAAGTGYGIKSELYKEGTGAKAVYTLVAVREYLGEVTVVTPANPEDATSKRTITVELTKVPTACETTVEFDLKTEEFAKGDMVIVTMAGTTIKTIALAETVTGVVTEIVEGSGSIDKNTYTIDGEQYVMSQNSSAEKITTMSGEEDSWYVDSMGNLIGDVVDNSVAPKHYGVLLAADGLLYVEAVPGTLLGEGSEGQEANEVVKILTAEGKEVVYTTAWEYVYKTNGDVDYVTYINGDKELVDHDEDDLTPEIYAYVPDLDTPGTLVEYTLDEDGKIATIVETGVNGAAYKTGVELENGKATLSDDFTMVLTDKTLFFLRVHNEDDNILDDEDDKWVAYTGYKTVPAVKEFSKIYTVNGKIPGTNTDDGTYTVVMIEGKAADPVVTVKNYIYFADVTYTEKWDAAAKGGKGDTVYVYDKVYLNGEKATVTFATKQTSAVKGQMYEYVVNATNGALEVTYTNKLTGSSAISLTHADFFKAGDVYYVDADTVYYQITKTGLVKLEALPTVKTTECIVVNFVAKNFVQGVPTTVDFAYITVDAKADPAKELADAKADAEEALIEYAEFAAEANGVTVEDIQDVLDAQIEIVWDAEDEDEVAALIVNNDTTFEYGSCIQTIWGAAMAAKAAKDEAAAKVATVDTLDELKAAAANDVVEKIILAANISVDESINLNGKDLDGNGYKILAAIDLDTEEESNTGIKVIVTNGGKISNLTISGGLIGIDVPGAMASDLVLENVVVVNAVRALHIEVVEAEEAYELKATGCTFSGKLSYGAVDSKATFTNCKFEVREGEAKGDVIDFWNATTFTGCDFESGFGFSFADLLEQLIDAEIKLVDCTVDGEAIADATYDMISKDFEFSAE